jgi:hypothetical protein
MKKNSLLIIFLMLFSCIGTGGMQVCRAPEWKQQEAQRMYNAFGTSYVDMNPDQMWKTFGACYRPGDQAYVYKTLWNKKYILVRYGVVIIFAEGGDEDKPESGPVNDKFKNYNRVDVNGKQTPMQQQKSVNWF